MEPAKVISPAIISLPEGIENNPNFSILKDKLSYTDKRASFQYKKWKEMQRRDDLWIRNQFGYRGWFVEKFGREALDEKVREFKAAISKSCLYEENGRWHTYTGLHEIVSSSLGVKVEIKPTLTPDDWKALPWVIAPPTPRWYQQKAVDLLCPLDGSRTHGAVSMGTGLGKSLTMALILKRIGLKAVVVVPSKSIAAQMTEDLSKWFGKGKVGKFGDGKKQHDKFIVVAIANSLMQCEEGDVAYDSIATRQVLLCDESHTCPPDSLSTVMFGLLKNVPYRYFFSGTQFRNDGLGLLLQGITNDVVFDMSVKQGIEEGFLSPIKFVQWRTTSSSNLSSSDIIKMNKVHLQQNDNIYKHAANLINRAVIEKNRRVLVLVDGVGQFKRLLKGGLNVSAKFAHGGVTKENKKEVPEEHWKSNPMELVKSFDNGDYPVLVGTSCIGMGTDIKSCDFIVSIVGLTSEIEISQNAGRGTRLFPNKKECIYNDYWVTNIKDLDRHANKRREIFDGIYGTCKILEANK